VKVSYNWLSEFVDIPWEPKDLAHRLEASGTAVESITDYAPRFTGVVTGIIKSIEAHPQADKLQVTTIDAGTGEELRIVCGASNIEVGQKVPVAIIDAVLPGGQRIEKASLRGVESHGMLCSETELELGDDSRGIMILDDSTPVGKNLDQILNLNDTVIEFEITPNRPDCMSMIGIAREVAALTGGKLSLPAVDIKEAGEPGDTKINLESPDLCPRYTARTIRGLTVGMSPFWMRRRLSLAGIRPINNLVDVTNYVLLETGQPLHGFDQTKLRQNTIIIKRAAAGESMTTLDGVERELSGNMLVIADGDGPIALAGVMGGENSEINQETTACVIESAYFEPTGIFRTSFDLDLRTEASARIERGTDPNGTIFAVDRAAYLMQELVGGRVAPGLLDEYPFPIEPNQIAFRPERARAVIGANVTDGQIHKILRSLDIMIETGGKSPLVAAAPTFRPDLTREIDLVEEIARVHGFSNIKSTIPDAMGSAAPLTPEQQVIRDTRELLSAAGLRECVNYSFIDPADIARLLLPAGDERADGPALKNPLSANQSVMRPTLLPGLLRTTRFNAGYGTKNTQIFEIGRVYMNGSAGQMPREKNVVAGLLTGAREDDAWYAKARALDFYDLKGILEALAGGLSLIDSAMIRSTDILLHPGQQAQLTAAGHTVGSFGLLHPSIGKAFELEGDVFVFELDAAALAAAAQTAKRVAAPGRFPAMTRDISFLVEMSIESVAIDTLIKGAGGDLLIDVQLFDLYEGEHVPAGKKSLAYRLTYQSPDRTLTVEETDAAHEQVLEALKEFVQAEIR
jgi:phenylalanyl-tRNA synthetase beta chain